VNERSNRSRACARRALRVFAGAFWAVLTACSGSDAEYTGALPQPDGALFVHTVYPILLRDCAFSNCHGMNERFLQVYGPGRIRLDAMHTKPDDPMTLPEVLHSYDRARSMLATDSVLERSLLLGKPLEPEAGGQGHKGVDDFGRNVFVSTQDPAYLQLLAWARSTGLPPTAAMVDAATAAAMSAAETMP
jgi:hypothetical protein